MKTLPVIALTLSVTSIASAQATASPSTSASASPPPSASASPSPSAASASASASPSASASASASASPPPSPSPSESPRVVEPTRLAFLPLPSLQWIQADQESFVALRWEVSPLAFVFGVEQPWRALASSPADRHGGSFEVFASAAWVRDGRQDDRLLVHAGARVFAPVLDRGRTLSASIGGSFFDGLGTRGFSYEAGLYVLGGMLGAQVAYAPQNPAEPIELTLQLRLY